MAKLAIARHAQSTSNSEKLIAGVNDVPLTPIGEGEARNLGLALREISFHAVYTSVLTRTIQTAQRALEELGSPSVVQIKDERLNERNWGVWAGQSQAILDTPEGEEVWKGWNIRPPHGESRADVYARSVGFLVGDIIPRVMGGDNVLLVGHNGSLKCIQMYLEGVLPDGAEALSLPNCGAKVYEFDGSGPRPVSWDFIQVSC
jgi:2,3-bisphosphoglycerate-dependent phosphoglycerate mutase